MLHVHNFEGYDAEGTRYVRVGGGSETGRFINIGSHEDCMYGDGNDL